MDLLYDLMFLIREILQPRPDTLYDLVFRTREFLQPWYLEGMCDLLLQTRETRRRYVQSGVSNPWDPEVHSWYIVGMYDL